MNQKEIDKTVDYALQAAETLQAILTLQYYDKNHLYFGTNPGKLNEEQRELVSQVIASLKEIQGNIAAPHVSTSTHVISMPGSSSDNVLKWG